MRWAEKFKTFSENVKKDLRVYKSVMRDKRTPAFAKLFLCLAIGYLLMPFDLIPDFIPVLGQIDDIILVPLLFYFAFKMIPQNIITEHRNLLYELN